MLNGFTMALTLINSPPLLTTSFTYCLYCHHLTIESKTRESLKSHIERSPSSVLKSQHTYKMSGTENQQQPSLVGGHAEYVKGAAEVSLLPSRCCSAHERPGKCQTCLSLEMIPLSPFTQRRALRRLSKPQLSVILSLTYPQSYRPPSAASQAPRHGRHRGNRPRRTAWRT